MNIFKLTIDYLKERGWAKGRYRGPNGQVCLSQALFDVKQNHNFSRIEYIDACRNLEAIARKRSGNDSIVDYNDEYGTSKKDIFSLIEEASIL
jgi:hypothetical protein